MHLTLSLEEELVTLDKYGITPNELLLVRGLLLLQQDNQEELFLNLLKTFRSINLSLRELLLSLQKKGIVLQSYTILGEGMEFDPFSIPINKNFIKGLYKASFELGKELLDEYPAFGHVNGIVVGLKSVSKKFDSLEHAYFKYGRAIGWNSERHQEILELVRWAKEHNIINYTLASFLVDERWNELKALRDGNVGNINYDVVKLI